MEKVPVDYQDYENEASEWADMIADNKIAEKATLDYSITGDVMLELDQLNFDLDLTGFDKMEIEGLMNGGGFTPDDDPQPRLDQLDPIMVKCPKCEKEFDARENKITNSSV